MSYIGDVTATNLWLRSSKFAEVALVLWCDGYATGFTTTPDHTALAAAWSTATGGSFTTLKAGLQIDGSVSRDIKLFAAQLEPSSLTFTITDYDNTLLPLLYGEARTDIGRSKLLNTIDANDTTIGVRDLIKVYNQTHLYLGHERILAGTYDLSGRQVTGCTRGVSSLHETADGSPFARTFETSGRIGPEITSQPLKWINRNCGLYLCHKVNGTWSAGFPGSAANDAELLWAGRIKHYNEDGQGRISLDCVEVQEQLNTSIGTRLYKGELQEGGFLSEEETGIAVRVRYLNAGTWMGGTYDGDLSALANIRSTHQQIANEINEFLGVMFITNSGTYAPATARLSLELRDGKYVFVYTDSNGSAWGQVHVNVSLNAAVWSALGWQGPTLANLPPLIQGATFDGNLWKNEIVSGSVTDNIEYGEWAPEAPLKFWLPTSATNNFGSFSVVNGDPANPFVHQTRLPPEFDPAVSGFLLIDDTIAIAVIQKAGTTDEFYYYREVPYLDSGNSPGASMVTRMRDDTPGKPVKVSQLWLEPGTIGEQLARLLLSTGTSGFNHEDYDTLPLGMGAGIPASLVDIDSVLAMGDIPWLLVVSKATPLNSIIESMMNLLGKHLTWKDSALSVVTPIESAGSLSYAVNENSKATEIAKGGQFMEPFHDRTTCDRNPESIINRLTLKYHFDLGGSPQRNIEVVGVDSQSEYSETRSVVIPGIGIYDSLTGQDESLSGGASSWERNVAATALAYFGKPLSVIERSYDFSLAAELYPGAKLALTDNTVVNPLTGSRGVNGLLCWVVSTSFNWLTGVGKFRAVFSPSNATTSDGDGSATANPKTTLWAPSARVDETYTEGASSSVLDLNTVALYKFDETSVPGAGYATAVDAAAFGGTARNLTATGEPASGPSKSWMHIVNGPNSTGYARWFPGAGDVFGVQLSRAGDATGTATFTGSYSIEMWFSPAEAITPMVLFAYVGDIASETSANNYLTRLIMNSSGRLESYWESGSGVDRVFAQTTGTQLAINTWYHLAMTVDNSGASSVVRFYINGSIVATSGNITKASGGTSGTWRLGGVADNTCRGSMKDVRISNVRRSDSEVAASAALTVTYQHPIDANTVCLWRLQEAPDAIDQTAYGYHLRKVGPGAISIVDPLAPDSIRARSFSSSSYYTGHWGYGVLSTTFTGDWAFEAWCKFDSGYTSAINTLFAWWGNATEAAETNGVLLDLQTNRRLRVLLESGLGVDTDKPMTSDYFSSTAEGESVHHIAVVFYESSPGNYAIEFYKDGVLIQTLTSTAELTSSIQSWLNIGTNSDGTNVFAGRMDDVKISNVRRTASEVAYNYLSGYHAALKRLKLKAHEYTAASGDSDVSYFSVGDKVHIVDLSPTDPDNPVEWTDTIAARDTTENTITLTTGLASPAWPDRGHFVVEWDSASASLQAQRLRGAYISDSDTEGTGVADDDGYLWGGDPTDYPAGLTYDATQRYRRINNSADDTGQPVSVHKLHEIRDFANQAILNHSNPVLFSSANTWHGSDVAAGTYATIIGPVWLPLYSGRIRTLSIKAKLKPNGTATYRFKTTSIIASSSTPDFEAPVYTNGASNQVIYEATSASGVVAVDLELSHPATQYSVPVPGCWFSVDVTPSGAGTTANPTLKALRVAEINL